METGRFSFLRASGKEYINPIVFVGEYATPKQAYREHAEFLAKTEGCHVYVLEMPAQKVAVPNDFAPDKPQLLREYSYHLSTFMQAIGRPVILVGYGEGALYATLAAHSNLHEKVRDVHRLYLFHPYGFEHPISRFQVLVRKIKNWIQHLHEPKPIQIKIREYGAYQKVWKKRRSQSVGKKQAFLERLTPFQVTLHDELGELTSDKCIVSILFGENDQLVSLSRVQRNPKYSLLQHAVRVWEGSHNGPEFSVRASLPRLFR